MLFALLGSHPAEVYQRTPELVAFHVIEGPHLIAIEVEVRLRHQGLSILSNEAQIFDAVGQIPLVIEGFPLAVPAESTHCRPRTPVVLPGECHFFGQATWLSTGGV